MLPRLSLVLSMRVVDDTALPLERRRALARHRAALGRLEAARLGTRSGSQDAVRAYEFAITAEKRAREEAGLPWPSPRST